MRRGIVFALPLPLLFVSAALLAQVTSSSIFGTVTDTTGAVVPGVEIKVTQQETNFTRTVLADESGKYLFNALPLGTYRVEVSAQGFKKFSQIGIVLEVNRNARVDPVIEVGGVTETVSITADAPLINTTDASVGHTVDNKEILTLPLVNRDLYTLLTLTPGVDQADSTNPLGSPAEISVVNGSSSGTGSISYYLDGGNNTAGLRNTGNALPNPDAVQEFRVITNSYSAEFGRFAAGMVDVVTKSGTNAVHGSLFEYLRNDALNATSWGSLTKPPLRRNQFGGSFGGPIVKDRTFYFGSYSGLRQRKVDSARPVVATSLERTGNFSASKVKPTDPVTKLPFDGGIIPSDRFDPTAKNILDAAIPLPNLPNSLFDATASHPMNTDELQFKIDHQVNSYHMLTGSYYRNKGEDIEGMQTASGIGLPWSSRAFKWTQQNLNVGDNWNISPTTFNQLRLTYVRNFGGRINSPAKSLADFGSKFQVQGEPALPQIQVSGFFTLGQAIAGPIAGSNYYGLRELFNWNKGRHALKAGGEISLEKNIHDALLNNYGVFSFDGSRSGNAFADFLLGLPRSMSQDAPITKYNNGWYYGAFVQDDFRIHPRLTLNLGLRYDVQTPFTDPLDRQLTFVNGVKSTKVPSAPLGLLFPGDPGVTRGIVKTDTNNIAPRIGLAWDAMGDGKTSVRAAFGKFFGSISANEWNQTTDFQPFSARQTFTDVKSLTDPYANLPGGVSPYPYVYSATNTRFLPNAAITAISPDFQWPYTYQMNLSVQRQLTKDLSVTAAYVGTLGHRWPTIRDVNYPVYGPGATAANLNDRRPIQPAPQTYSSIAVIESVVNNSYHGLQLTAEKRTSHGVSFKGFYTFGKALEGANEAAANGNVGMQDATKMYLEKGRTNADRRHNFVMSTIWDLKYYNGSASVLRHVLNGWGVSTIIKARSGAPFTVTSGRDNNLDGNNNDRADLIGNPQLSPNRSRADVTAAWFNTAVFKQNAAGQPGTAGRNILDKPGMTTVDLGLMRTFKLGERLEMQFRAEATNAFNMVNLRGPNTTLTSSAFGTINEAEAMRELQLGMRFAF
jgi:Carboxypeptidase regulatory-like domain/TonB dependent receptor